MGLSSSALHRMNKPSLLITLPIKDERIRNHANRLAQCEATWLKSIPDWKAFSDSELNVNPDHVFARQLRMKGMAYYAWSHDFDAMFRADTDTYIWADRLLAYDWNAYDYIGLCGPAGWAHGGAGLVLSRKAMKIVAGAPPHFIGDHNGDQYGDMWVGQVLAAAGIKCHYEPRFYDGNIGWAEADRADYLSYHPLKDNMIEFHERV